MRRLALVGAAAFAACATPAPAPAPMPSPSPPGSVDAGPVAAPPAPTRSLFATIAAEHRARLAAYRKTLPYLKGSTHVHTLYSGDSRTRPRKVVKWYSDAGYDFIVITDHNRVTDGVSANLRSKKLIVIRGIELTNNPPKCDPPPPEPKGKCRVHVNSLFVETYPKNAANTRPEKIDWRERKSIQRVDQFGAALVRSEAMGGLAQLNHPTWYRNVDGALLTALAARGLRLVEIANVAFDKWNRGTDVFPSTEAIWDAALTAGHVIYGVASDDAHHYYDIERRKAEGGALYPPGGGFVMVRAARNPASIRAALERGDFYASTGLLLRHVEVVDGEGGAQLVVEAAPTRRQKSVLIEFISKGKVVARVPSAKAVFPLTSVAGSYVRARVTAGDGASAWTQPVFVKTSAGAP